MSKSPIKEMIYCSMFAALICLTSLLKISIFISSVPITLQTMAIMLAGVMLGKKWSVISVIIYISLGIIGLPVFSGPISSGAGALLGPTGGFLLGFIPGVYIIAIVYEKLSINKTNFFLSTFVSMSCGLFIIYILGGIQFAIVQNISFAKAFSLAIMPFILVDYIKMFIAILMFSYLKPFRLENKS